MNERLPGMPQSQLEWAREEAFRFSGGQLIFDRLAMLDHLVATFPSEWDSDPEDLKAADRRKRLVALLNRDGSLRIYPEEGQPIPRLVAVQLRLEFMEAARGWIQRCSMASADLAAVRRDVAVWLPSTEHAPVDMTVDEVMEWVQKQA